MWACVFDWHTLHRFERNPPQVVSVYSQHALHSSASVFWRTWFEVPVCCLSSAYLHPPVLFYLYGAHAVNMSKWLPWRKRSFFRKQRKKFSFPLLGKSALSYFLIHWTLSLSLFVLFLTSHSRSRPNSQFTPAEEHLTPYLMTFSPSVKRVEVTLVCVALG